MSAIMLYIKCSQVFLSFINYSYLQFLYLNIYIKQSIKSLNEVHQYFRDKMKLYGFLDVSSTISWFFKFCLKNARLR